MDRDDGRSDQWMTSIDGVLGWTFYNVSGGVLGGILNLALCHFNYESTKT
jgi:hypothetical protein